MQEINAFKLWLLTIALGRIYSIWMGYKNHGQIHYRIYPQQKQQQITPLFGRLFATWTSTSVALVLALVYNTQNWELYWLNCFVFLVVVLNHFLMEWFIYRTGSLTNTLMICVIAGFTGVYMIIRYLIGWAHFDTVIPYKSL
jgi:uncharacterized membrane protein